MEKDVIEFNRSKIYEKLDYLPQPPDYSSKVPWIIQNQIAATNGIHYVDRVGKLTNYPIYELPVNEVTEEKLMLDIGCGWGRWLVAGSNKGYIPIGIDLRLEFCEASLQVLKNLNKIGYTVVADLENIPFKDNIFELIWSFSVIQHTHYDRMQKCLQQINKMLTDSGFTLLEFPNKNGLRNRYGPVLKNEKDRADYNNWCVRYYTVEEYEAIFNSILKNFEYSTHSFLGIGVLKEDLKYVSFKNKLMCSVSLLLSEITKILPGLSKYSDSLYIKASKKINSESNSDAVKKFLELHKSVPGDNLNIIHLLKCPKYGTNLVLSDDKQKVISMENGIYYPIIDNIPILIESEAISL